MKKGSEKPAGFSEPFFTGETPSQALPRQLPQRGSQAVTFVAEALSVMRKLPAVLLPLPLGEVDLRSKDGEGARCQPQYPLSLAALASSPKGTPFGAAAKFPATAKAVPLGKVASPQAMTEGVLPGQAALPLSQKPSGSVLGSPFGRAVKAVGFD